jgi:hypothetical protein
MLRAGTMLWMCRRGSPVSSSVSWRKDAVIHSWPRHRRRPVPRGHPVIGEWLAGALHDGEHPLGASVERGPDGGGLQHGVAQVHMRPGVPGLACLPGGGQDSSVLSRFTVAGGDDDVEGAETVGEVGQVCRIYWGAGAQAEFGSC